LLTGESLAASDLPAFAEVVRYLNAGMKPAKTTDLIVRAMLHINLSATFSDIQTINVVVLEPTLSRFNFETFHQPAGPLPC
jgi:hypothetical protein